ncbi:MAG: acetohydroxyacid synthase small subunit [Cryomorphaceae bacterium BACL29 MAG-121220-bin8]|jgi:acetolactate synthase I/III small subunit|nr:MAG: acetohydroxyacid synthase small subunit [Cryomorphaceae bacterium BACL29 MAG-121220-bin8]|tara:strand:+ start:29030 stop:29563 length:534 start_codon:yes stop_codon:yes gene_type:complete
MSELNNTYTISVYTENNLGLLNRISAIFLKRHISIESFTTSESEIENIFRFIIVVSITKSRVERVVKQIEKQIEVIAAFYHSNEETIFLETALYKIKSQSLFNEKPLQKIIKNSQANIITVSPEYFVIEKTGWRKDTEKLYYDLEPYGLLQFVRSGRISVSKEPMNISNILGLNTDK